MYQYICHTCGEDEIFRELECTQAAFNEHAQQQHEVVLRRLEPATLGTTSGPDEDVVASKGTTNSDPLDG